MFGVVIISHAQLANGFKSAAEMIVGQSDIVSLCLEEGADLEKFSHQAYEIISKQKELKKEVVVLTDIMYGTPFNRVVQLMDEIEFHHFTGLCLAVLLEVILKSKTESLASTVKELRKYCSETFIYVNQLLKEGDEE